MNEIRFTALAVLLSATACASHEPPPVPAVAATVTSTPAEPEHPWPGGDRADLVVPDEIWSRALRNLGRDGGKLGYSSEEMNLYKNDRFALRTVTNLFRDVRTIPRFSGAQAKALVKDAASPGLLVERAYAWTDVRAGRMLTAPKPEDGWGVDWIPKDATPEQALSVLYKLVGEESPRLPGDDEAIRAFARLPVSVQRLVVRVYVAVEESTDWIVDAYRRDESRTMTTLRATGAGFPAGQTYSLAAAPFTDEWRGLSVTHAQATFAQMATIDREYLAFGSVLLATWVGSAIDEYRTAPQAGALASPLSIVTPLGAIRIFGIGDDEIPAADATSALFTVDLGGNDRYVGSHGVPQRAAVPIGLCIDLGGNDTYDGGDAPASLACGLFGFGAIFDVAGNDKYRVKESGLGCGWFGTGLLMDYAGDDEYVVDTHWGQGVAHVGAGLLVDLEGNDTYTCGYDSQAHAGTLGAALLLDVAGNDRYLARDDGNISELYLGQSVAMSQGAAQGRRADIGDGHSMAGGVAFLVDGAGDDSYHATAWSQGCGYWWAAGFLEDLGGNDTYRNGKYSAGAAAHFAIGCQVDLCGDDKSNVGNDATKNQYQGHARDGSIGISIDGDGNDVYKLTTMCGGASDLTSIGFLWDRRGDDVYEIAFTAPEKSDGWSDTPPLGTSSLYPRFNDFRDDLDAWGLFLDTGGADRYDGPSLGRGDLSEWASRRGPRSWGYGLDVEWFPRAAR